MNNWTRETHLTIAEGKRLIHLNRKLGQKIALLEKQLQVYERVRGFYSEDHCPEFSTEDYERICHEKCKWALERSGHHYFGCENIYGKLARQSKLEIDEIQKQIDAINGE